jgi:L-glyceraldehyde 3-phosphate reductase
MEKYFADPLRYDGGMKYERCGRSGVLLPKVSLGFWHNFGGVDSYERSRAITHYAFDHGITHFDLANNYGPPYGSAEETMGRLMDDDFHPYRDELFISSKAGYDMWPGPYGNWGSRKYLMASLDQSLKRMHLDYVDLFYSHRYDPETPLEETLQALVDIVRAGKALYVGISRWPLEATRFAYDYLKQRDVPLLIYQGRLNMLDREPQQEGIMDFCAEQGVGFISFSPLAQGLLTDRYLNGIPADSRMSKGKFLKEEMLTPELLERLRRYNEAAAARGETLAEMALAWILAQRGVTSVLVGASSTEQLAKNLKCINAEAFEEGL